MAITVARFLDVANGLQPNQFRSGRTTDRLARGSRSDLQAAAGRAGHPVLAVMGGDGRPNLTPMWFDYEGDRVLVNVASHRKKVGVDPQESAAHQSC